MKNVAQFERALKVNTLPDKRAALDRFYPWQSRNYRERRHRARSDTPSRFVWDEQLIKQQQIDQFGQLQQLLHWSFSSSFPLWPPLPRVTKNIFFRSPLYHWRLITCLIQKGVKQEIVTSTRRYCYLQSSL